MSAQCTPGPLLIGGRTNATLIQYLWVPLLFWNDHQERCPSDDGEAGICYEERRTAAQALIYGSWSQIENLRSDARFYADGNVDDCARLVRSAKATLAAIAKATGGAQ